MKKLSGQSASDLYDLRFRPSNSEFLRDILRIAKKMERK